ARQASQRATTPFFAPVSSLSRLTTHHFPLSFVFLHLCTSQFVTHFFSVSYNSGWVLVGSCLIIAKGILRCLLCALTWVSADFLRAFLPSYAPAQCLAGARRLAPLFPGPACCAFSVSPMMQPPERKAPRTKPSEARLPRRRPAQLRRASVPQLPKTLSSLTSRSRPIPRLLEPGLSCRKAS